MNFFTFSTNQLHLLEFLLTQCTEEKSGFVYDEYDNRLLPQPAKRVAKTEQRQIKFSHDETLIMAYALANAVENNESVLYTDDAYIGPLTRSERRRAATSLATQFLECRV